MYVNGAADGTATGMSNPEQGTQEMDIGYNSGVAHDGALMFTGSISGTYVYGAALTAAQIQSLYRAGPAGIFGSLPSTTALSITSSGAALDVDGVRQAVASLSGVPGSSVYLGNGVLTVGNSGSTVFAGDIRDSGGASAGIGGSLILDGPGSLELSGTDTYTGGTTVEDGKLVLATAGALEDGTSLTVGNPSEISDSVLAAYGAAASAGAAAAVPEPGTIAFSIAGLVVGLGLRQKGKGD